MTSISQNPKAANAPVDMAFPLFRMTSPISFSKRGYRSLAVLVGDDEVAFNEVRNNFMVIAFPERFMNPILTYIVS